MAKTLTQFILVVVCFFAIWLGLNQVNWMKLLHIDHISNKTEEKLGKIFWEVFKTESQEIKSKKVIAPIDSLVTHICAANDIDRKSIKLHLVDQQEINAFALPDGHLVVFSGLISASENEAELCGVIGHEIAHIQKRHVMKKLVKEVGVAVLASMTTGGAGGQATKEILSTLTSKAYDRNLEREADLTSVTYMIKADIDPEPFADFLYRLSLETEDIPEEFYWVSTHPESKDRSEKIQKFIKNKRYNTEPVLALETWEKLKAHFALDDENE